MKKKTVVITGASRGVGAQMARRLAQEYDVVLFAKTSEPHPKLSGTIHTVAKEIEDAGGRVLPLKVDVRHQNQVEDAMEQAAEFGGGSIYGLINNASALPFDGSEKQLALVKQVIVDGTHYCTEEFLRYSKESENPHVINIAPPLPMADHWIKKYGAYAEAKRTVSEMTELRSEIRPNTFINALWPKTMLFTAATKALFGDEKARKCTRNPSIMADAVALILKSSETGRFFTDESALRELGGVTDFSGYLLPGSLAEDLMPDVFV